MGLFDKLLKRETVVEVGAAMAGSCIDLKEVPDEAFSQGLLGQGVAVVPTDGKVYAPADGELVVVFPTGHAVAMKTAEGIEILIHVGLDTVTLEGEPFTIHAVQGAKVKKCDLLLEADLEQIKAKGLNTVTPILISNANECSAVEGISGNTVSPGDVVIRVTK